MWKNELEKFDFKMDEIKLFDAFAGKGALHKSLKKLGIPIKVVGLSEIEPDAIIAYAAVHINDFKDLDFNYPSDDEMRELLIDRNIGWDFIKQKSSIPRMKKEKLKLLYKATILTNNLGDISKLDYDNMFDFDLFNLSFPCTDLSGAGKQKGLKNEDGTHTRSGLIKFGLDVIKAKKPKYIMIENVKALIQKKFINDFYSIINEIESYGYKCFYPTKEDKTGNISPTCLNAKDYGIPQNRERIFVICVRNDINLEFEFLKGFDRGIRLKDILENNVEDKYYLGDEIQKKFKENYKDIKRKIEIKNKMICVGQSSDCETSQAGKVYETNGISPTLCVGTHGYAMGNIIEPKVERIGGVFDKKDKIHQAGSVYNQNGLSPTITTCEGGYRQPIIPDKYYIKKALNMEMKENYIQYDNSGKGYASQAARLYYLDKNMGSLPHCNSGDKTQIIEKEKTELCEGEINGMNYLGDTTDFKIRKLTPLECWRLMGFDDEDFYHTKELGLSDSSLYKLAGNSIVVNCLYYIFKEVFKEYIINKEENNTYIKTA
ncbi:DNA (cytosine-5-)-methyltransferase [Clostridium perfringens]|nr:DNA (cytosine-5-)-methyltransferase [Clostridium perfringens]